MKLNPGVAAIAAIWLGSGIAFGAFGAHGLKEQLSAQYLAVFETGVRYQMYAGFGLLFFSICGDFMKWPVRLLIWGSFIFCLSVYAVSLNELFGDSLKKFGAIAPIGGLSMIAAWAWAAWIWMKNKTK